jgi:AmmeMemoRadiSam system protein B
MTEYAKMRAIEAIPVDSNGQRVILLRDPERLSPAVIQVSQQAFFIISLLDGKHSTVDLQAEYVSLFGELLYSEKIEEIVKQLDENYFLDNKRFKELYNRAKEEFRVSPTRLPAYSGSAYPDDPQAVANLFHSYSVCEGGPGGIEKGKRSKTLRAAISPHIDFARGGVCYASAYKAVAENCDAKTFVILATAHTHIDRLFALTKKEFQTPLGAVPCDTSFCESIEKRCAWVRDDEFAHRTEHSVEFQALFLKYVLGSKEARIVPILCGSFHDFIAKQKSPKESGEMQEFLGVLRELIAQRGDSVCVIAGADLSHVGLRFGNNLRLSDTFLAWLRQADEETLKSVELCNSEKLYETICSEGDRRRVCGLPPIYTLLETANVKSGKILKYDMAVDYPMHSVVSFASVAFE